MSKAKVIVIEGIIGVGKTTLGEVLSKELCLPFFKELRNDFTVHMLDKFYSDMPRWAFASQINFLNERFALIKKVFKDKGGIVDRSFYSDCIFGELLHEEGCITEIEYHIYSELLSHMKEHVMHPTLLIYLDGSVDKTIEKIKTRNRECEVGISRDYLGKLNTKHLEWYDNYTISPKIKLKYDNYNIFNKIDKYAIVNLIKNKLSNISS